MEKYIDPAKTETLGAGSDHYLSSFSGIQFICCSLAFINAVVITEWLYMSHAVAAVSIVGSAAGSGLYGLVILQLRIMAVMGETTQCTAWSMLYHIDALCTLKSRECIEHHSIQKSNAATGA